MSELQKELDADRAFIEMVEERIYKESDNWEDSIAEPEWIMQMTDIADKYLSWFKAAENGRRQVVQDKAKLIEMRGPELNENQEIVLEWLKEQKEEHVVTPFVLFYQLTARHPLITTIEILDTFDKLTDKEEFELIQAFSTWALDQC